MKSREEIIKSIIDAAKLSKHINAAWELGAVAFDRVDEFSDIDLVFVVDDDFFEETFDTLEDTLKEIAPLEHKLGAPNNISNGAYQNVYRLEGYSEFLVIEICFIPSSTSHKPVEKEIHGEIIVHLDKRNILNQKTNVLALARTMKDRYEKLKQVIEVYQFTVKKEIMRNNPTEAYFYYFSVTLNPLLELVRMHYSPFHYNFRHRYVYFELPQRIVEEIEEFTFIKNLEDLEFKHKRILERFKEEILYLDKLDFLEHLNNHK
ncbi:aminoglycoside 6-adenylyltransferase [Mycoplasmatota bacterium WC44]